MLRLLTTAGITNDRDATVDLQNDFYTLKVHTVALELQVHISPLCLQKLRPFLMWCVKLAAGLFQHNLLLYQVKMANHLSQNI